MYSGLKLNLNLLNCDNNDVKISGSEELIDHIHHIQHVYILKIPLDRLKGTHLSEKNRKKTKGKWQGKSNNIGSGRLVVGKS